MGKAVIVEHLRGRLAWGPMQTTSPVAPLTLNDLIDEIDALIGPDADTIVHQFVQQGGE